MVRQGRGQQKASVTSPTPEPPASRTNVDLFMECVDEDLAPSQKEANRKAANEYKSAVKQIETVRKLPATPIPVPVNSEFLLILC